MSTLSKAVIYFIRFLRVVIGLGLIAVFMWALGDQKSTDENYGKAIGVLEKAAAQGIPRAASDRVEAAYEGNFVYLQGPLSIGEARDPLTGFSMKAIRLVRIVEMLQWQEEAYQQRMASGTRMHYRWNKVWSDRIIASNGFHKTDLYFDENRDNPKQMPYEQRFVLHPSHLTLGAWPIRLTFTDSMATQLDVSAELLRSSELADGWFVSGEGNYLYPPLNATSKASDAIGAIRIRYDYTALDDGQYSAVGRVKDGSLDDTIFDRVYGLPLMAPGDVSADVIVGQTISKLEEGRAPQKNWIGYVFVGLLLCIGVFARALPFLRKGFTEAPFPRRAIITVVVAAVGTAIAGVFA